MQLYTVYVSSVSVCACVQRTSSSSLFSISIFNLLRLRYRVGKRDPGIKDFGERRKQYRAVDGIGMEPFLRTSFDLYIIRAVVI